MDKRQIDIAGELRRIFGESEIVAEPYIITEHDQCFNNGWYRVPEGMALHFSYSDTFSLCADGLKPGDLVTVIVHIRLYRLYLAAGLYQDMEEFQDLSKMHRIKTECLLAPGDLILLPECNFFQLTCVRYRTEASLK